MSNYFNSLPHRLKVQELGKCDFMQNSEFANGVSKLKGKKILRDYIKSRSLMAERKNINYISQYFVEYEKINDIKIYQIIFKSV